ncbi:ABC transporter ATP-binding protein [Cronobacter sakazakii]|uniref:ABC transporter ATP-binding protein n=1 Tax=Cronobacter sakazakii TaxID=28141 RepID=UPI0007AB294A|nr:ABC transporter ATP-binding protein [Cronobacter sakazakii]KZE25839.1 ABC transporter ATP-binding protein [Cronobacter sakazakii]
MTEVQYNKDIICLRNISHSYPKDLSRQVILNNISLSIPHGQSCAIVGASGSGKSTLLNIIGLLDKPNVGSVFINGTEMSQANIEIRAIARNQIIGFVFQSYNLLPRLTILDNVALPLFYRGVSKSNAYKAAKIQLNRVGLSDKIQYKPADLSGGQRQRVAIARSLIGEPILLLADEPTGNLDSKNAEGIINLLMSLNQTEKTTLLLVTHDKNLAGCMSRCIEVHDGTISERSHANG